MRSSYWKDQINKTLLLEKDMATPDQWEALTGKAELNDFLTLFVAKQITSCAATNRSRAKLLWRRHCETNWLRKNWNYKTRVSVVLIKTWFSSLKFCAAWSCRRELRPSLRLLLRARACTSASAADQRFHIARSKIWGKIWAYFHSFFAMQKSWEQIIYNIDSALF